MTFDELPYRVTVDEDAFARWWSGLRPELAVTLTALIDDLDPDDDADLASELQSVLLAAFGQEHGVEGDVDARAGHVLAVSVGKRVLRGITVSADLDPSFDTIGLPDGGYAALNFWFDERRSDKAMGSEELGLWVKAYVGRPAALVPAERPDAPTVLRGILSAMAAEVQAEIDRRRRFARKLGALALDEYPEDGSSDGARGLLVGSEGEGEVAGA